MGDLYTDMARYYDSENAGLVEDLAAYDVLAGRFGGPVLDVGCGTGRVGLHMATRGLEVVGIDASAAMLDRARAHAADAGEAGRRVEWAECDVRDLSRPDRFGLAVFAFSGFMHLLEHSEQVKALERISAHLKPGGGLVIDLANPIEVFRAEDSPSLVVERLFTDAETGHTVMQQSLASFDRISQVMSVTWVYDRISPDGLVHRALMPQRVRYTFASEMSLLLQHVGLGQVEVYGDYNFNEYEEESPRLFVVATRVPGDATRRAGR
jgi:2-polyprenyl-3-methyl-5-hydroxy-6-metoxy-1,4-benzoquinol methylase